MNLDPSSFSSEEVAIVDHRTSHILQATVFANVGREELRQVQTRWSDYKRQWLLRSGVSSQAEDFDSWNWPGKHDEGRSGDNSFYAVSYENEVQGLMMLGVTPIPSRREGHFEQTCLYVEFIESAPWNLAHYVGENVRYGRIGAALISAAVRESRRLGCEGRIALHSLPGAEGFYRRMEFIEIGFDDIVNLNYFELPTQGSL